MEIENIDFINFEKKIDTTRLRQERLSEGLLALAAHYTNKTPASLEM